MPKATRRQEGLHFSLQLWGHTSSLKGQDRKLEAGTNTEAIRTTTSNSRLASCGLLSLLSYTAQVPKADASQRSLGTPTSSISQENVRYYSDFSTFTIFPLLQKSHFK